jgi:hypothetical protein
VCPEGWRGKNRIGSFCCRFRLSAAEIKGNIHSSFVSLIQKAQKVKKDKFKNKEDSSNKRDNWWNAKL